MYKKYFQNKHSYSIEQFVTGD